MVLTNKISVGYKQTSTVNGDVKFLKTSKQKFLWFYKISQVTMTWQTLRLSQVITTWQMLRSLHMNNNCEFALTVFQAPFIYLQYERYESHFYFHSHRERKFCEYLYKSVFEQMARPHVTYSNPTCYLPALCSWGTGGQYPACLT